MKTNFQKRVSKARKLSPIICATNGDKKNRLAMPSLSNPEKHYHTNIIYAGKRQVKITDDVGNIITVPFSLYTVTCEFPDYSNGRLNPMVNCPGNSHSGNRNDVVCYHSMGSVIKLVENKGKAISLVNSLMKAVNLLNLGGKLVKVVSAQGSGAMWGVVK
jgi:hypothetical protein